MVDCEGILITYSPVIDQIVFRGCQPLTGNQVHIIFNEQNQTHKRLLMWNELLGYYMYSTDAGLTWDKVDLFPPHETLSYVIEDTDLILKWWNDN